MPQMSAGIITASETPITKDRVRSEPYAVASGRTSLISALYRMRGTDPTLPRYGSDQRGGKRELEVNTLVAKHRQSRNISSRVWNRAQVRIAVHDTNLGGPKGSSAGL